MGLGYSCDTLRRTILGQIQWHRCLQCEGTGYENWDENGEDIKSGKTNDPDRADGECDNCNGLGFIQREV